MPQAPTLDHKIVSERLRPKERFPFGDEEDSHLWEIGYLSSLFPDPYSKPFLRLWDRFSGSQPIPGKGMLSRAPGMRLDTAKIRTSTLAKHLDYGNWTAGPYISFTNSPDAIEKLVLKRAPNRGPHTLTIVDPITRTRNRLPFLNVENEMDHYSIQDPYGQCREYYTDHYVCLWQVTEPEIVTHLPWSDLADNEDWYQEIVMPAFRRFRSTASTTDGPVSSDHEIDTLRNNKNPDSQAKHETEDVCTVFNRLTLAHDHPEYSDSDISDDPYYDFEQDECGWDTDDEVQEANEADDIVNFIEGNWY